MGPGPQIQQDDVFKKSSVSRAQNAFRFGLHDFVNDADKHLSQKSFETSKNNAEKHQT